MKVCLVIQSEAFRPSAGMRIRYGRLIKAIKRPGISFRITVLNDLLKSNKFEDDVYLFVKVFNPLSTALGFYLNRIGKTVGQDLFDDYFSQNDDARLARYRTWLSSAALYTKFVICTTSQLREVVSSYFDPAIVHVVDDPFDDADLEKTLSLILKKQYASTSARLKCVWFGIGDNPYFNVGVQDLVGQADVLGYFESGGFDIDIDIVTNVRALTASALRQLRALPVPFELREWSKDAESESLEQAHFAFIPVNAQPFSRSKSSNRCLTALLKGCQVLAPGFPVYGHFQDFIYDEPISMISDFKTGSLRLSKGSFPALKDKINYLSSPEKQAESFTTVIRRAISIPDGQDQLSRDLSLA